MMKDESYKLWIIGNCIAVAIGILLSHRYNFAIGAFGGYALVLLVDIRHSLDSK